MRYSYVNICIVRRNKAVKLIQQAWREAYYNPKFKACKTRLHREFCTFEKDLVLACKPSNDNSKS